MRNAAIFSLLLSLCALGLACSNNSQAQVPLAAESAAAKLTAAAFARTQQRVRYDGRYMAIDYPGGDVPNNMGVCTDVVIRSYRNGLGIDLQQRVHEDMRADFAAYPKIWGLTRADSNIDHRRVPNLERYFQRQQAALPLTDVAADYLPGDIVSWRFANGRPHIGIVSDRKNAAGMPLIIHNAGFGTKLENVLFAYKLQGHFRYLPGPAVQQDRAAQLLPSAQQPAAQALAQRRHSAY